MSQFTDQFAVGGVPINEFMSSGTVYFVRPSTGSDGNNGKTPSKALKTVAQAKALATHFGDTVYVISESNTVASTFDLITSAGTWSTNGVHLIGLGAKPYIGSRAGIRNATSGTGAAAIEDMFTISANNCYVRGLSFFQGDITSTASAPRCLVVSGMRNRIENCQISGNGDTGGSMDAAGARSLAVTGAENYFKDCYIGLDTVIRATQTTEVSVGAVARTIFEDCLIQSYTSLSTFKALTATNFDRFLILKNCILSAVQNITSSVAPTGAIANTTPNGDLMILGGGVFGYARVITATDSKALLLSYHGVETASEYVGVARAVTSS